MNQGLGSAARRPGGAADIDALYNTHDNSAPLRLAHDLNTLLPAEAGRRVYRCGHTPTIPVTAPGIVLSALALFRGGVGGAGGRWGGAAGGWQDRWLGRWRGRCRGAGGGILDPADKEPGDLDLGARLDGHDAVAQELGTELAGRLQLPGRPVDQPRN